ncbi:hypothetical protein YH63_008265 [Afipia massiliensis]|uniref:Uncharacterized protein n=1 Tax=Afipia massiliensis TaxID=211460 RepID=A0A4U6BMB9_9BRAD|nr:hypothetical protein [Afipia massiliensis]TKT71407.1 hypothetical protein YH63_008265 [Afipia massiliensis]
MGLFQIEGTITSKGASQHDHSGRVYSFIELTEASGRRVRVETVGVSSAIDVHLELGATGTFYFDRLMGFLAPGAKHLWGVKSSSGEACFDPTNVRFIVGMRHMGQGLMLSLFIIGLPLVAFSILEILGSAGSRLAREQLFYGSTGNERRHVRAQEAVRI